MPSIIAGNNRSQFEGNLKEINYDYNYPEDFDLKPGSEKHEKMKNEILERARQSSYTNKS